MAQAPGAGQAHRREDPQQPLPPTKTQGLTDQTRGDVLPRPSADPIALIRGIQCHAQGEPFPPALLRPRTSSKDMDWMHSGELTGVFGVSHEKLLTVCSRY